MNNGPTRHSAVFLFHLSVDEFAFKLSIVVKYFSSGVDFFHILENKNTKNLAESWKVLNVVKFPNGRLIFIAKQSFKP